MNAIPMPWTARACGGYAGGKVGAPLLGQRLEVEASAGEVADGAA